MFIKFILFLVILFSFTAQANEKVSLQLLWKHQFEFAGFYMAKEKGFYNENNLDVNIKEFHLGTDVIKEVESQKSTFGIAYPSIVLNKANGSNVVLLNSVFQSSPHVLVSLKSSNIKSIQEFKNKRIMIENNAIKTAPIMSMLYSNNIHSSDMKYIPASFNINDLINLKTDIFAVYISNEIYKLNKLGIDYTVWNPSDYGFDFYNDIIFTSSDMIKNDKNKVIRFQEASLKGWEYAFKNIDETIEVILKKYNTQNKSKEELLYEAKVLKKLAYKNNIPFGDININKIRRIYDIYNLMGLTKKKIVLDEFLYIPNSRKIQLSKIQTQYINEHPIIKVHNEQNWPPYNFNENGKAKGFSIDYMNLLAKKIGIDIEYVHGYSWSEFIEMIKNNDIDVMLNIRDTKERRKFVNFTKHYITASKSIFTNNKKFNSLDSLSNKIVSVPKDFFIHKFLKNNFPNIKLNVQEDAMACIEEVIEGRADAIIGDFSVTQYLLQDKGLSFKYITLIKDKRLTTQMNIGTSKKDSVLRDILDKAILLVSDEEKNHLKNKWLGKSTSKSVILTSKEKEFLKSNPVITVQNEKNWPPYNYNENGVAKGFSIDYMNLLASKLNIEIKYKVDSTWSEYIEMLESNELDIMLNIRRIEDRNKKFNFTKPYVKSAKTIFTNIDNINSIEDLKDKTIAVTRDYYMHSFLEKYYPNIKLHVYDSTLECIQSVVENKSDAIIDSFHVINYLMLHNGINIKHTKIVKDKKLTNYMNIATTKSKPILRNILQKAMDEVTEEENIHLRNKWFGSMNNFVKKEVGLTFEEKKWIMNNAVSVGIESWKPIMFYDKKLHNMSGIGGDILKLVIKKIGLKINIVHTKEWDVLLRDFKAGDIDILPTTYYTKDRAKYGLFTKDYLDIKEYLYVKSSNNAIETFADLKNKKLAIVKEYGTIPKIRKKYPSIQIIETSSLDESIELVLSNKVDALFDAQLGIEYHLLNNAILGLKGISQQSFDSSFIYMFSSIEKPILNSILTKGLNSITINERNKIISKWINVDIKNDVNFINKLTKKEFNYLKNKKVIKMCNNPNWEPIEFAVNGNMNKMSGIAIDTIKLLENKLHVRFENVMTKDWSQSQEFLKEKKCDILPAAVKTLTREKYANFTEPYLNLPLAIITTKDKQIVSSLDEIMDKTWTRQKGSGLITNLYKEYPNMKVIETKSDTEALKYVNSDKAYFTISTLPVASNTIMKYQLNNLHIAGYTGLTYNLSIAVRNDDQILLGILNSALKDISNTNSKKIMKKWINTTGDDKIDYSLVYKLLVIIILIGLFFIYREYVLKKLNEKLKYLVDKQTSKLKKTNSMLTKKSEELNNLNNHLEKKIEIEIDRATKMEKKFYEREKMAAMGEMIGNIAHQWRQPLSVISTLSTGITMQKEFGSLSDEKLFKSMDDINNSAQFLSKTIDDFRDLVKGDTKIEKFNLSEIIEKCLNIELPMLKINNITLIKEFDNSIILESFPNSLVQSMLNIINNASDILKERSLNTKLIFIETYLENENVIIKVKDNAGGIPQNVLPHIFEAYFTTKHKTQGTGLGLNMTYSLIVDEMKGNIIAENITYSYNDLHFEGALLTITLPLINKYLDNNN